MPKKNVVSTTQLLSWLALWMLADLFRQVLAASGQRRHDHAALVKQFCQPNVPPVQAINKAQDTIAVLFEKGEKTSYYKISTTDSEFLNREQVGAITLPLRDKQVNKAAEVWSTVQQLPVYQHLLDSLTIAGANKQALINATNRYLRFTSALQSTDFVTQTHHVGNCHEFSVAFLAALQRHFFAHHAPLPNMGLLKLLAADQGHALAILGIPPSATGEYQEPDQIAALLKGGDVIACDGWNHFHHVPATALCQAIPALAPTIPYSGKPYPDELRPYVNNFYSSLCEKATYEGLPPYPTHPSAPARRLMRELLSFIFNETQPVTPNAI